MEYASKGNLCQSIEAKKEMKKQDPNAGFSTQQIMKWLAQITVAMMFMHNKDIEHRDIKTQNIFISSDGIIRLGDFGISRKIEKNNDKLKTAAGTPYFMAPETITGDSYDEKADMWSVGVILYELITLKKPFEGQSIESVFMAIMEKEFEALPAKTDPNLVHIVNRLLTKDHK